MEANKEIKNTLTLIQIIMILMFIANVMILKVVNDNINTLKKYNKYQRMSARFGYRGSVYYVVYHFKEKKARIESIVNPPEKGSAGLPLHLYYGYWEGIEKDSRGKWMNNVLSDKSKGYKESILRLAKRAIEKDLVRSCFGEIK